MGGIFIDTGGSATNSGSRDANVAALSGAAATVAGAVVSLLTDNPDLSSVDATEGSATQDRIYINDATNANIKSFRIVAKDNTAGVKTVTVHVAPTGVVSSAWAIGGRYAAPAGNGLNLLDGAFLAGDVITVNNSPAAATVDWVTGRTAGSTAGGPITVKGATGTRPVINITNTTQCIEGGSQVQWKIENLELDQDGASGNVVATAGNGFIGYNVKVSDGGGVGFTAATAVGTRFIGNAVSGVGSDAITLAGNSIVHGNYLHDVTGMGVNCAATGTSIFSFNVIDTCGAQGISLSGAFSSLAGVMGVLSNTVYGCGNSGLEITDADANIALLNNIFSENGNAAGEFNVEWVAGDAEKVSFHAWNVFFHSGGGGGANLSNLTANAQVAASEFITDPAFTDAAGGDFSIGSASPAKATGYPGLFLS